MSLTYSWRIASPQRIFQVERILRENGHDVLVPVEWRWRRLRQRYRAREQVAVPKLGPYGFITFPGLPVVFDEYFKRRFGFRYLGDGFAPLALPEGALEKVMAMSEKPKPRRKAYNSHGTFRIGERVKIMEGPFADFVVDIKDIRGRNAIIMLELFGSKRDVQVDTELLDAA